MTSWWRRWRIGAARRPRARFTSPTPIPVDQYLSAVFATTPYATPVSRAQALQVAAVQRSRNELAAIATLPLRQYRGNEVVPSPLLAQIDPDVPNVITLAQTVEDLVFEGTSWWRVTATDFRDYPIAARHLDHASVSLHPPSGPAAPAPLPSGWDPRGATVWIDGQAVPGRDVIRFDSPNPGLLQANARSIHRALLLDQLAAVYADNPRPLDYFTDRENPDLDVISDDEVDLFLARWRWWRKKSGTGWIPGNVQRVDVNAPSPAELQLAELQQQVTLEIANGTGVDPEDLGVSTTSRTYFNATDRRREKVNRVYGPYMSAISQRLSMGDVTPYGNRVEFDLSDYLKSDPLSQVQYWQGLMDMGVTDADEVRGWAGLSGPAPADTAPAAAPAPAPVAAARVPASRFTTPAVTGQRHYAWPAGRFTTDTAGRVVSGLAVPYGVPSAPNMFGDRVRFDPGSLEWSATTRVKHLVDHARPIGKAVELTETPAGLEARLDVQPGDDGDRLLAAAAHGTYDGLSVGVDFQPDSEDVTGPDDDGVFTVHRATLLEISTCAIPAFDDARVAAVALSRGDAMHCVHCGQLHRPGIACVQARPGATLTMTRPDPQPDPLPDPQPDPQPDPAPDPQPDPGPQRTFVDPRRGPARITEPAPYRLSRTGRGAMNLLPGSHDFSSDLFAWFSQRDQAAHDRAMAFVRHTFTDTTDILPLAPPTQRPDLYVDQRDYTSPIWDAIDSGSLTDVTPFVFPKFNSATGLVGPHIEGQEPTPGDMLVTSQTVTPSAVDGKARITRLAWDQGGNPQISTLIWNQMLRGWREGLEARAVAELDAASPQTITLTVGGGTNGQAAVAEIEAAEAALHFQRGGFTMTDAFTQIDLYSTLAGAKDDAGRPLLPMVGAANANGTAENRFGALIIGGVQWLPAWALAATGTVPASSYLFDRQAVHGWAGAPQRFTIDMTEVANVYIGLIAYCATAISDLAGVREVVYDPSPVLTTT